VRRGADAVRYGLQGLIIIIINPAATGTGIQIATVLTAATEVNTLVLASL
jgi:hypothetical protein